MITSAIEISMVNSTSCTEARMVVVRSRTTVRSIAAGIEARNCGQRGVDAIDGIDDVRAGLAEDDDQHRGLAVDHPGGADVLDRIAHHARRRTSWTAAPLL